MPEITAYNVPAMSCGHCKKAIASALSRLDPLAIVTIDLQAKTVEVDSTCPRELIMQAIVDEGYPVEPSTRPPKS